MESITNRNAAFHSIIEKLPENRRLIFELIQENKQITAQEISEKYQKPINEITGRITELKNYCFIVEAGSRENRFTSKQNTIYQVIQSEDERINLINKRFVELRDTKDSLINDYNLNLSKISKELLKKEINKIQTKINFLEKIQEQF